MNNFSIDGSKPSHVKKAISNMRTDGEAFDIIRSVCSKLKLKYECPSSVNDIAVHFTIPKCKLAILFKSTGPETSRKAKMLENSGWTVSTIHQSEVISSGVEVIKKHLSELLIKENE